jgi:hypothetical protein
MNKEIPSCLEVALIKSKSMRGAEHVTGRREKQMQTVLSGESRRKLTT